MEALRKACAEDDFVKEHDEIVGEPRHGGEKYSGTGEGNSFFDPMKFASRL